MAQQFTAPGEISREVLAAILSKMNPCSCRYFNRDGLFSAPELELASADALIDKIVDGIHRQDMIAQAAMTMLNTSPDQPRLVSYFWEVNLDTAGVDYKQQYVSIDLVIESALPEDGHALLPILFLKCRDGTYKYWEVLDQNDALEAVRLLLNA